MVDYITSIYNELNVTAITSLLAMYNGAPALFAENIIPDDCNEFPTINFYQVGTHNGKLEYGRNVFIAACRSELRSTALNLGGVVLDNLNRKNYPDYYLSCQLLSCINPQNSEDKYNQPVEITIYKRS